MKRLTLLVCLVAIPIAIFANAHEPYQGDFDLDGDVDFEDFLTFASNYGKTGGSTTPSNRVDTVRVVVRDTIYIDSGSGGNTGNGSGGNTGTQTEITPPDLASLGVRVSQVPTGWNIKVTYLDLYGSDLHGGYDPKWRNPDKITVIILDGDKEVYRGSDNIIYRGYYGGAGWQRGLEVLVPKSEISDIYDQSVSRYTTRVVVEFDGKEYTSGGNTGNGGGGNQGTQTDSLSIPRDLASLSVSSRKIPTGISIRVNYWDRFGSTIQRVDEIWRNPDKITVTISRGNTELYSSTELPFQRTIVNGVQLGIDVLIPKSEIPNIYADWSSSYTIRVVVEFDGEKYTN